MQTNPRLGWQAKALLAHLFLSGAPVQRVWGCGHERPVSGGWAWWSIYTRGVAKVRKTYPLNHHHCHEEEEMGSMCRWLPPEGIRGSHTPQTLLWGKAAASMGHVMPRTWQGNFLAWYDPQTVTHYWSSMGLERKTQSTGQEQSKKTSRSFWEKPLRTKWPQWHRGQSIGGSPSHSWIYDVSPKMAASGLSERWDG